MYPLRTLESFAETIGPDGTEFGRILGGVQTFELNGQQQVTFAELQRVFAGSRVEGYLRKFTDDIVWVLHFDPQRDMQPTAGESNRKIVPRKPNCIASAMP